MKRIEIDGWATGLTFSASHFIPRHGKCGRLHGHTYAVHVRIRGEPDENGLIADFGNVKKAVREVISELDHKVLLPMKSKELQIKKAEGHYSITSGENRYVLPESDVVELPIVAPTAEEVALFILERLYIVLGAPHLKEIEIGLDEGVGQGAWMKRSF